MAGERKGKVYEALVMVALKELKKQGKIQGEIFWNKKPDAMTIEPDFTIGDTYNCPGYVLLVTHSGSAGNSGMKFWRNIGELAEAKIFLPVIPYTYSVVFDSVIYDNLKVLQENAFDGQIIIGDKAYGSQLRLWVEHNYNSLPRDKEEKVDYIENLVFKDTALAKLITSLVNDMSLMLSASNDELDNLWQMERKREQKSTPAAKNTFIRRGLSKLLIFEDISTAVKLYRGQSVKQDDIPQYAFDLGLVQKTIGGARPNDIEMQNAVTLLSDKQIKVIMDQAPLAELSNLLSLLRNIHHIKFMGKYVVDTYEDLCDASKLYQNLKDLYNNPLALVNLSEIPNNWPPSTVWLLEYLIELLKSSVGTANGYGIAQLARDVIDFGYGTEHDLSDAGQFGGGFGLSSWIARKTSSPFRDDLIFGIAAVISDKLTTLTKTGIVSIIASLSDNIINNIIEAKLCTYPSFDPLYCLIKEAIPDFDKISVRAAFTEKAGLRGQVGNTVLGKIGETLVNWQSASDAGRDHKRKELCGRAVALRYSWDASVNKFVLRPGVRKLILVVDGTWRQKDLDALSRAGWDEIFYPDEMDKLAKAIV